jgi:hypothetical protein
MTLSALGIFSAAGVSLGGDYELISTAFGTGSSGVIEFTSIPSTYKHLQIRFSGRSTSSGVNVNLTVNGVTTASYARHFLQSAATTETSGNTINQTSILLTRLMASSVGLSSGILDVLDYSSTTKNKTFRTLYGEATGVSTDAIIVLHSGAFFSTAAIETLTFTLASNSFATNSRFSLYGIRG